MADSKLLGNFADASNNALVSTVGNQTIAGTLTLGDATHTGRHVFNSTASDIVSIKRVQTNAGAGIGIRFENNATGVSTDFSTFYGYAGSARTKAFAFYSTIASTSTEAGIINTDGSWILGPNTTVNHRIRGGIVARTETTNISTESNIEINNNSWGFQATYNSRTITSQNGAAIFLGSFPGTGSPPVRFYVSPVGVATNSRTQVGYIGNNGNWFLGGAAGVGHTIYGGAGGTTAGNEVLAIQTGAATTGTCRLVTYYDTSGDVCGYINIDSTNNTISPVNSSDQRLKHKFEQFSGLDLVQKMQPLEYERITGPGVKEIGLVAQDLAVVCPQLVSEGGEDPRTDPWGINYTGLIPVLTRAIQELKAELDEAKAKITALEAK